MKTKRNVFTRKLILKKETVANLSLEELSKVKGGAASWKIGPKCPGDKSETC